MARKMPGEGERMEVLRSTSPSALENAELPGDGQSTVVGGDGQMKPLNVHGADGVHAGSAKFDQSRERAPRFVVTKTPKVPHFMDPTTRQRATLREGKEVDAANYDLDAMRRQGFTLEPIG